MEEKKRSRGLLRVDVNECKGCGMCVEACPPKVISMSEKLNHYGYRTATYAGEGCTACGICFMVCPEPGAITVLRAVNHMAGAGGGLKAGVEGAMACASN
ncbi:MAG: 4Fe-4S dicluster domain-containing protein [Acidobacteriota bacterium]|nr:4Fe-4S dicluster domain-containing protein [Acidobacteriota bacterium]